ncbi:MAG TPA: NRDE family protein, partial [Tahibacter sp.]|nr:NRDE family protein [Tahibacter sp.]
DAPWPKMQRLRALFDAARARDAGDGELLDLLTDRATPPDAELPDTGIGLDKERFLSPVFVRSVLYGTRASTLAWRDDAGRVTLRERSYDAAGQVTGDVAVD